MRWSGRGRIPREMPFDTAANYGEPWFRAYDKATGEVLAEIELPAGTTGAPITYMHDGKQYIVVAVGGRDRRAGMGRSELALKRRLPQHGRLRRRGIQGPVDVLEPLCFAQFAPVAGHDAACFSVAGCAL